MGLQTYQLSVPGDRTLKLKMKKDDAKDFQHYVLHRVLNIQQYQRERTGTIEPDGSTTDDRTSASMILFGCAFVLGEEGQAAKMQFIKDLPEIITLEDIPAIKEKAQEFYEKYCIVNDKRETREAITARHAETERLTKEREVADALKHEKFLAAWAGPVVEIPAGSTFFTIQGHYDDSDMMSDYHNTASYGRALFLAFGRDGARREEDYRAAISRYPELVALAWKWERREYSMGRGTWLESGVAGETEGVKTYGGHENPAFYWEVRKYTSRETGIFHAFKGYVEGSALPLTAEESAASGPITVRRNEAHNGVEIVFSAKPPEAVREGMKAQGFRWSGRQGLWYAKFTSGRYDYAQKISAEAQSE